MESMSKRRLRTGFTGLTLLVLGCGKPGVTVSNDSFEPRIVLEGLLMPGHPIRAIRITRNWRLDQDLNDYPLTLTEATVDLVDEADGSRFPLTYHPNFHPVNADFQYDGNDLTIEFGGTYTLEVSAELEGQTLFARATTTVPEAGFRILGLSHERLAYRPKGPDGEVVDVKLQIERSPGVPLYLMTVTALDASDMTFVWDNPFVDENPDEFFYPDFDFEWEWLQNPPLTPGISTFDVFWWDLWFYSEYEIVVFAADANYARFIQTFDEVQEEDGNFHAPVFSIEGDGIGYFGSAIPDTVYLEVTR